MGARIRIEQQFVRIEAVAGFGLVGTMRAETIKRARPDSGNMAVEDFVGIFGELETLGFAAVERSEESDFDLGRMGREDREIRAAGVGGRAERVRLAFADPL
jgi:hypothetical protein